MISGEHGFVLKIKDKLVKPSCRKYTWASQALRNRQTTSLLRLHAGHLGFFHTHS